MSPQAEADDFTIEFTTLPTILRILIFSAAPIFCPSPLVNAAQTEVCCDNL